MKIIGFLHLFYLKKYTANLAAVPDCSKSQI